MNFSIISVYNDKKSLRDNLLPSLKKQTRNFEQILIDNRNNKQFNSAASALNSAAKKARGKYLLFIHQDIILDDIDWLKKAEVILNQLPDLGIAGVAGLSKKLIAVGYIDDAGLTWGKPFKKPQLAQTLDECLFIIPRKVFKKIQFDENNFDHWHCYAVDYSLVVADKGLKVYTLPLKTRHMSRRINMVDLSKYQARVYKKHQSKYKYVATTCGILTPSTIFMRKKLSYNPIANTYEKLVRNFWTAKIENPHDFIFVSLLKRTGKVLSNKINKNYD